MSFCKSIGILALLLTLAGCGDNLLPSSEDKRPPVEAGSSGGNTSQKAPEFAVPDINGATVTLASSLAGRKGAVFYFTMWCPICDVHSSHLQELTIPQFPDVGFYLVDYVSGTVADAASAARADGYAGGAFSILADTGHILYNEFQATMGTTVVIDSNGIIQMNEDYKDGTKLQSVLAALP